MLNVTNNRTIRGAFGDDCDEWTDKIIVVFPTMVDMRGRMTPALRVRIPPPKRRRGNGRRGTAAEAAEADTAAEAVEQPRPILSS